MPYTTDGDFLLAIFHDGAAKLPEELPGETARRCYFPTTRAAKEAGRAILERHPDARGLWVRRVFNAGHYRTTATEVR